MAGYVGWVAILKRHKALSTDNLRRALKNSTDSQDIFELQQILDTRPAYRKATNTPPPPADIHPILQLMVTRMPQKPYFSDDLSRGTRIREKSAALRHREIQPNRPWERQCLVQDIDHTEQLEGLPPPNVTVTNPENGHRHAVIIWKTPVLVGPNTSRKAQMYYQDIATAVGQCWQADSGYTGLLMHNPLHSRWHTEIHETKPYELSDFAGALRIAREAPANHPRAKGNEWADEYWAKGRNCATWEACRWPAYALGHGATLDAVLRIVESYNATHNQPLLGYNECKHIARSISNYVRSGKRKGRRMRDADWRQWVEHTHRPEVQATRGRKGGKASGESRRLSKEQDRATARILRAQGRTQTEIAAYLGVNQGTIARWLKSE